MAKKSKDTIRVDFGKEEASSGGRVHWKPGDYHVKILGAKGVRSAEKDTPGVRIRFQVIDGKRKGQKLTEELWLTPKSLVRLRRLLEACGIKVPKSAVNVPLGKLKGKKLWIEVDDDKTSEEKGYGKRSRVVFEGFISEADYEADPEEDDEDEEDEDEEDDEDDEEEDEDEEDEDDEDDEDEDDEDDDEEEDEKPRRKKSKAKSKKKSKKSSEDLEELDLDDL